MRAALDELRRALESGEDLAGFERLFWAMDQFDLPGDAGAIESGAPGEDEETEDDMMLALLLSEALEGVDIAHRYPQMFRRLLADGELRAAFLDGLALLENENDAALDVLPVPPSRDLSFLKRARRPVQNMTTSGDSLIRWQRSAREVATLFASFLGSGLFPGLIAERGAAYDSGYRGDDGFLEEDTITLLHGRLSASNIELDVTLEGLRPADRPNELQLTLWVVPVDESAPAQGELALLAIVSWGDYEAQVEISGDGRYTLPPRRLDEVAEELDAESGDLHITLQHKR